MPGRWVEVRLIGRLAYREEKRCNDRASKFTPAKIQKNRQDAKLVIARKNDEAIQKFCILEL